jgi:hypothetical protein
MGKYLEKFLIFRADARSSIKRIQVNPKWFDYPTTTIVDVLINDEVTASLTLSQLLSDVKISAKNGVAQAKTLSAVSVPKDGKLEFGFKRPNSHGASGGTTDINAPTVTAFEIPAAYNSLDVEITVFTAVSYSGILSYLVTASSTAPSASDLGWSITPPETYTVATPGIHTLYAWAKDALGVVSMPLSASVMVDTDVPAAPIITNPLNGASTSQASYTFSGTSEAYAVVHLFRDNEEIALAPANLVGSWSVIGVSLPDVATFTFSATAEDAAGNISPVSALVVFRRVAPPLEPPVITSPQSGSAVTGPTVSISVSSGEPVAGRIIRFWSSITPSFESAIQVAQSLTLEDGTSTNPAVPLP